MERGPNRDSEIFSEAYQRKVLKMLLVVDGIMPEASFAARFFKFCKPYYFDGVRGKIYEIMQDSFGSSSVPMSIDRLRDMITNDFSASKSQAEYIAEISEIGSANIETRSGEREYVKKQMENYVKLQYFVESFQDIASDYRDKRYHDVLSKFKSKSTELYKINFSNDGIVIIDDYKKILEEERKRALNPCTTGIDAIDKQIGGLAPQTWTTFLGSSNVGKSMLTWSLTYENVLKKKKVLISIHEDEEGPTKLRALSAFSGIDYNKLKADVPLSKEEEIELEVAQDLLSKYVKMVFMYGKEATIEKVHEMLRVQKEEWSLDLYICDYGQCLSSEAFKSRENSYELQGYIYEQLKQICLELNIAGAGSAQVNRSGNVINKKGTDLLRTTDVGDSFTIIKKSSNVITMNRSDSDIRGNRIFYLLDKARQGICPILVQSYTKYSCCRTILREGQIQLDKIARPDGEAED